MFLFIIKVIQLTNFLFAPTTSRKRRADAVGIWVFFEIAKRKKKL